ncbi:MAG TPA: serine/threonine-protein kinase, partial [Gemmatirosa sp.]|nr:serine/threonine-protein kinase [Gemmatirosa sp.]
MPTEPAGPAGAVSTTDPHAAPAVERGVAAARWRVAQELFLDAVEQPTATRAAWLDQATTGDDALRGLVEQLLAGDADAPALLDTLPRPTPAATTGTGRLAEGATIGSYTVRHELGRGGMGTVYLVDDAKHGRQVALKVLHDDLRAHLAPQRFQREVRLAARLQHPHLLTVFDSGDDAGRLWYTMPYIAGETLRARLRRESPLPVAEAVRVARELAQGLAHAHAQHVVHRDVKPENVLLATDGSAVLGDFGVSRAIAARREAEDDDSLASSLTGVGMVVGTPQYMSPEQATGAPVDASTDVYALACVLYEMLVGEPPYPGPTLGQVHRQRLAAGP